MKKCQVCGNDNSDDMRFCLNCGKPLPDAPMVFNLQDSTSQSGQPSSPGTNPYGKSPGTQFNQPAFQQPQQNYSMAQPAKKGGSKKLFIAVGGVVALFLLILVAVGGIIGYNILKDKPIVSTSPTPTSSPSGSPSSSPSSSKSASPSPKSTDSPSSTESVTVDPDKVIIKKPSVKVDYNKTEEGVLGMWIHLKFEVTNMKDVDSYAIVYFQKNDDSYLEGGTGKYRAKNGRVAAIKGLKPGFDPTVYEDLQIFMPYSSLNLSSGKYNLKMDVDLTDKDENLIKHIVFNDFKYDKE